MQLQRFNTFIAVILSSLTIDAYAIEWINPAGGDFFNPANWNGGVPGPADRAIFNLSSPGYDVLLSAPLQNTRMIVGNDNVNFVLNPATTSAYFLTGESPGGPLTVGSVNGNNGNLNFSGGALVLLNAGASNISVIGDSAGATGTLTLENAFFQAEDSLLRIGRFGAGTFNLMNSAAETSGRVSIAEVTGSTGSVLIDSSTWNHIGNMEMGFGGQADISIVNAGSLNATDVNTGTATINVSGPNSRIESTNFTMGGISGPGLTNITSTLNINQGGKVTVHNSFTSGFFETSTGNINVNGNGSQLTLEGTDNNIGLFGKSNVTVSDGGTLYTEGSVFLGGGTSGAGNVTVTGAGSSMTAGTSTFNGTGILVIGSSDLSNPSTLSVQNGATANSSRAFINESGVLNISNSSFTSTLSSSLVSNSGSVVLENGVINGNVSNQNTVDVSGTGTTVINGDFTNNGTLKTTDTTFQVNGVFTNNGAYISDPSVNIFDDLIIGADGYLVGGTGDEFSINGDFVNNSAQNALWDTDLASLIINGVGLHDVILGSEDLGDNGGVNNFSWSSIRLESGVSVNLLDDAAGDGSALYVGIFDLADGIDQLSLVTSAFDIFYDPTLAENTYLNGQEFLLDGGGTLMASVATVPIPAAVWLFGSGLIGLIGFARRKV